MADHLQPEHRLQTALEPSYRHRLNLDFSLADQSHPFAHAMGPDRLAKLPSFNQHHRGIIQRYHDGRSPVISSPHCGSQSVGKSHDSKIGM